MRDGKRNGVKFMQFIKFGLVGVLNTLISEGIYVIIVFFGGHYLVASLVGFVLSVLNAYYWNNKYVFVEEDAGGAESLKGERVRPAGETEVTQEDTGRPQRVWWKTLLKTYVAYAGGYLLNVVLLILWIDIVRISRWFGGLAQLCSAWGIERLDAQTLGEIAAAGINLIITVPLNFVVNKYWAFRHS